MALWPTGDTWGIPARACVVIGAHRIDIEAARRAGMHAVLFSGGGDRSGLADGHSPDCVLASFEAPQPFWQWLAKIDLQGRAASC
jgi:beta-phosphoglucomutase-like phosphatase (HAD superfamily)